MEEGDASGNHGTVICKLCVRHGKNNNFTGDGYQCVEMPLHVYIFINVVGRGTAPFTDAVRRTCTCSASMHSTLQHATFAVMLCVYSFSPSSRQHPASIRFASCSAVHARRRKGKRSALVDHHMKNKQHRSLMAEMDKQLRKVTIVSGMAQRLTNKVAIVTGVGSLHLCMLLHDEMRTALNRAGSMHSPAP